MKTIENLKKEISDLIEESKIADIKRIKRIKKKSFGIKTIYQIS